MITNPSGVVVVVVPNRFLLLLSILNTAWLMDY